MEPQEFVVGGEIPTVTRTYRPQELFLFSAATWNPHRVHYDQRYTADVEGHADLLVQGPLQAAQLFQVLVDILVDGACLTSVRYRHLAVLHVGQPVLMAGLFGEIDEQAGSAEVAMWMELESSGQRTTAGTAVVSLSGSGNTSSTKR